MNKLKKRLISSVLALSFAVNGAAYANNSKDDKLIKQRLNNSINSHKEIRNEIECNVNKGVVTLKGEVNHKSKKALAERLAINTPGVTEVKNFIVIDNN